MKLPSFKKEQQKNEKEIVSVDGVFFDNSQQFINLKKKQPFIEIHFGVFINFVDHFKVPIGIVIITFVSLAFLGSVFVSKANVATFYPDSCLGGWENPANASGKPDLDSSAKPEEFTKGNSAVIKGTSEIYCGGFRGEIPEDTAPKRFILSLSWSIDDGSVIHNEPQPLDLNANAIDSVTPQVIENPEDSSSNVPETPPETPPVDTNEPVSWFDKLIPQVYAQEQDPLPDPLPPVAPDPEILPVSDPVVLENSIDPQTDITKPDTQINNDSESPVIQDDNVVSSDNPATITADNSEASSVTEVQNTTEEPADSFMEVSYTIDGTTWNDLGKIGRNNWQNVSFDIPLSSWEDINLFQIDLKPIQTIDTYPTIYLDSVLLSVEYESELKVDVKEAVPIYEITNIENTGSKIVLSNEGTILSPDQILITSESDSLGNIAVYNKTTGVILLTATVDGKTYALDLSYFGEGEYTVINTTDPDSCNSRTLAMCLSSPDFVGSATFSVKNKTAPPETTDNTQNGNDQNPNTGGIDPLPGSTLPQIPSDPIIENAPDKVLDIFNIDDTSQQNNSTDNPAESQALPPVDTSSSQEVSF